MGSEGQRRWVRVDCAFDEHPDVLEAGFYGATVFLFLVRRAGLFGLEGRLPAKHVTPKYIAAVMRAPAIADIEAGLEAAIGVGLLKREDNGDIVIPGWQEYQNPGTIRQRKFAQNKAKEQGWPEYLEDTCEGEAEGAEPPAQPAPSKTQVPFTEVLTLYRKTCVAVGCPDVRQLTDTLMANIRGRWLAAGPDDDLRRETFLELFDSVAASNFLTGRGGGDRPFMADLRWLMKPENMAKVLEGRYNNRSGSGRNAPRGTAVAKWYGRMGDNKDGGK